MIRKSYWKKTFSKIPSQNIGGPQGLFKENKL